MPIPTELVGSLPRPMKLQQAYADYDEGKITWKQLQAEQNTAAEARFTGSNRPESRSSPTESSASRVSPPTH
jgi:hypothetical protein